MEPQPTEGGLVRTQRPAPPEQAIERLEHAHHTDHEAVTVQVRAVGRAIEELATAVEVVARQAPGGVPAAVSDHLEKARWELKDL